MRNYQHVNGPMTQRTLEYVLARLPKADWWLASQVADAFGVSRVTILRHIKKSHDKPAYKQVDNYLMSLRIGTKKVREDGARGTYILLPGDIHKLCEVVRIPANKVK